MQLAYCGLLCEECPVFLATKANDVEMKARLARDYSTLDCSFSAGDMTCAGCHAETGICEKMCAACPLRLCGRGRGVQNCAECADYPCETLRQCVPEASAHGQRLFALAKTFRETGAVL